MQDPTNEETLHEGPRFTVKRGDFGERTREWVVAPDSVAVVAYDERDLYLVRQPREAIADADFLEIPAGRLDQEGESPLAAMRRELAEEIGKGAEHWEPIRSFYTSVGCLDEQVHLYLATGLSDRSADADHHERIEIVRWPLSDLDGALAATKDSKTIIGLQWLSRRRAGG